MKTIHCTAASLFLGLSWSVVAQNFTEDLAPPSGTGADPVSVPNAQALPGEVPAVYDSQDPGTLEPHRVRPREVESVVNLAVLEKPSAFRLIAAGKPASVPVEAMKQDLALISATYRPTGKTESNCQSIGLSVEQAVRLDESRLLEIVDSEMKANPGCACEIVKTAIKTSEADVETVVSIVETSIAAAPETLRIVSQCAIAAMPESLSAIQSLVARYDGNAGESGSDAKSAKSGESAKSAKDLGPVDDVAAIPNPLDFPGTGPVGPTLGGPGGHPLITPAPPILITPPVVTQVDP